MYIRKRNTVFVFAIFLCVLCVMIYNQCKKRDSDNNSKAAIVPNKEANSTLSLKPQGRFSTPDNMQIVRSSSIAPVEQANPEHAKSFFVTQEFIVNNTGKNPIWSRSSEDKLRNLVSGIDDIKDVSKIRCGSYMCEVHVTIRDNLNEVAKNAIIAKLAEPIYTNNSLQNFTVRQIFSNRDVGDPVAGFFAFYQRTVP